MALFSVTSTRDTLRDTVLYLARPTEHDPALLGKTSLFLPTRRSCRRATRLFLENTSQQSLILPKLFSLGDYQTSDNGLCPHKIFTPEEGLFHLVRFLSQEKIVDSVYQAHHWAKSLLGLLEECILYDVPLHQALSRLLEDEHALHRQGALQSLQIFLENWMPQHRGLLQREDHSYALQELQESWIKTPPTFPLLALGIHAPAPIYINFLANLARQETGIVLLSDLDHNLTQRDWDHLTPAHPQWSHKCLLDALDLARADIEPWPFSQETSQTRLYKHRLLMESFHERLHETHRDIGNDPDQPTLTGISLIECDSAREEAWALALFIREGLEDPEKRVLMVTPDRELAKLIGEILKRWQILPDDGAGVRASFVSAFVVCTRLLEALSQNFAPTALLSLLKHPLFLCGHEPGQVRALARTLELEGLRTPFYGQNLHALKRQLKEHKELCSFLENLEAHTQNLKTLLQSPQTTLFDLLSTHLETTEVLCGGPLLWEGEHKQEVQELCQTLLKASHAFPPLSGREYTKLFSTLLSTHTLRRQYGVHPRISILSPQQAALAKADLVLLGGMNEGLWPLPPAPDPWLSPVMRSRLNLPSFASTLGEANRAFLSLACNENVIITRSLRTGGTPQTPARMLLRLQAKLKTRGLENALENTSDWHAWMDELATHTTPMVLQRPAPTPCLTKRPTRLSLSGLSLLQQNPYLFYARNILKLSSLDAPAPQPDARLFGTLIHTCLEKFFSQDNVQVETLLTIAKEVFKPLQAFSWVYLFWWQRFESMAPWIVEQAHKDGPNTVRFLEQKGILTHVLDQGKSLNIVAKADCLSYNPQTQEMTVIDYKTGTVPTAKEVASGLALQLPLESHMLTKSAFGILPPIQTRQMAYWQLKAPQQCVTLKDPQDLEETACKVLVQLGQHYWQTLTPFTVPMETLTPGALTPEQHLTRIHEWSHPHH